MSSNENVHFNFGKKNDEKLLCQAFIVKSEERHPRSAPIRHQPHSGFYFDKFLLGRNPFLLMELS